MVRKNPVEDSRKERGIRKGRVWRRCRAGINNAGRSPGILPGHLGALLGVAQEEKKTKRKIGMVSWQRADSMGWSAGFADWRLKFDLQHCPNQIQSWIQPWSTPEC